jgi:hypothetical protein
MPLHDALPEFGNLLEVRLSKGVYTTEDSVRYTLFVAILRTASLTPEEIVLEHPHPTIQRAQVDTWILPTAKRQGVAIEFKYDREIPSALNGPRTQKAGKVFHDIYRLGQVSREMRRIFVYLASSEMSTYFLNKSNGLSGFFSLPEGQSLHIDESYLQGKSTTFVQACGPVPGVTVKLVFSRSLPRHHELRMFEILDVLPATEA